MNRAFLKDLMNQKVIIFDGAMGTALQSKNLPVGIAPETFNQSHPELIKEIHYNYLVAGCDVITTNTFGANGLKFESEETLIRSALQNAKNARDQYYLKYGKTREKWIALDMGPLGVLMEPAGKMTFDEAYEYFKKQVIAGVDSGCDMILIETITDLYEAKCAILASVENSDVPVICTMSFESSGRTFLGTDVKSMVATLEGLGVSAIGFNCSFGAEEMLPLVECAVRETHLPLLVQPNAGLPKMIEAITVFDKDYDKFEQIVEKFIKLGVRGLGGCCAERFLYHGGDRA